MYSSFLILLIVTVYYSLFAPNVKRRIINNNKIPTNLHDFLAEIGKCLIVSGVGDFGFSGAARVLAGTGDYLAGTDDYLSGTDNCLAGTKDFLGGTNDFVSGTGRCLAGTEDFLAGTDDYVGGTGSF